MPHPLARRLFRYWISAVAGQKDARRAIRELLELDALLTDEINVAAARYGEGVHPKHRLMRYHDFFIDRVRTGERVLDVGCGKGEMAFDMAERGGASVVGIDVNPAYLAFARSNFAHPRVEYLEHDVYDGLPPGGFDTVTLSNVLEHLDGRVELLRRIVAEARPAQVLVRVPTANRHWAVPLREELGLPSFSDSTHTIEYVPDLLRAELEAAGLQMRELIPIWGELWAAAKVPEGAIQSPTD